MIKERASRRKWASPEGLLEALSHSPVWIQQAPHLHLNREVLSSASFQSSFLEKALSPLSLEGCSCVIVHFVPLSGFW